MTKPVVAITGASGFIGSALCVDLAKECNMIAIDRREPSEQLRSSAPQIHWKIVDIADKRAISAVFAQTKTDLGQIDFVIHLAAYYDFGTRWVSEYQRTNVEGTANVIAASIDAGVKRFIFASSIGAMEPPSGGAFLTEDSPLSEYSPYARSKYMGEGMLAEASAQLPCMILRIAGVFSDWCELPPLYGLIRLWSSAYPMGLIVPGRGESAIPYIHLHDLVHLLRKCLLRSHTLDTYTIILASPHGAVSHRQLFPAIRSVSGFSGSQNPIYLPLTLARFGTWIRSGWGEITGHGSYERPWMLNYVDKPWNTDPGHTQRILDWACTGESDILEKIPVIMKNRSASPGVWEEREIRRMERRYSY